VIIAVMRNIKGGLLEYSVAKPIHDPWDAVNLFMRELSPCPLECEYVDIDESLGRILCEDIVSSTPLPQFPRSLVDGYAVIYSDIAGASASNPARLRIAGRIAIGEDASQIRIHRGSCYIVDTGSFVPPNADLVIPFENASREGDAVIITKTPPRGANIAYPGSDMPQGAIIAKRGWAIDGIIVSAISSLGIRHVRVYRKPKACVASTGNELVEPGESLAPGRMYESNSRAISSILRSVGFNIYRIGILRDAEDDIERAITESLERCDIIIISGGTSAGVEDYLYRVIEKKGRIITRGIRYKPGKPLTLGVVGGKPIIGLPGNPVSVIMLLKTILSGLLRRAACEDPGFAAPQQGVARLLRRVKPAEGRITHVPSILVRGSSRLYIIPWVSESYMVSRIAFADVYIEIPYTSRGFEVGEEIVYKSLRNSPRAWILEAGEILRGSGIGDGVLRIYTPRSEAIKWLEMGAASRVYICRGIDIESRKAEIEILPGGYKAEVDVEIYMRSDAERIPSYPGDTCYHEALQKIIDGEKRSRTAEIPVETPDQALDMFRLGFLDMAIDVRDLEKILRFSSQGSS